MKKFTTLNESNVSAVSEIEKRCFGAERWSEELLRNEIHDPSKNYVVCVVDGAVVGFGGYAQVFDEGHIMNIAVAPEFRRKGIGTEILKRLIVSGKEKGITAFTLEVRVSNGAARMTYERAGFLCVGVRPKYYPDKEDACIYWLYM